MGRPSPSYLSRKSAGREPRLVGLTLVASVDKGGGLRRWIHGPVDLPVFVVVLPDLRIEATVSAVLEDVPGEGENHRRIL